MTCPACSTSSHDSRRFLQRWRARRSTHTIPQSPVGVGPRRWEFIMVRRLSVVSIGLVVAVTQLAGQGGRYPSARQGGNYMHNYYFAAGAELDAVGAGVVTRRHSIAVAMSGSLWNVDPATGRRARADVRPQVSLDARLVAGRADGSSTRPTTAAGRSSWRCSNVADGRDARAHRRRARSTSIRLSRPTARGSPTSRPGRAGNFNVYVRPIKDGQWAGDEIAVTQRQPTSARPTLLRRRWTCTSRRRGCRDGKELLLVSNRNVPLGSGNVCACRRSLMGSTRRKPCWPSRRCIARGPTSRSTASGSSIRRRAALPISSTTCTCSRPTGGEPYKMTFFAHDAFHPRWSPDGEWIAYISNAGGLPRLACSRPTAAS